tara:strand:+ start:1544 stop:2068 length:525 start_codon:yes stop_codon:yes gene_type:complete
MNYLQVENRLEFLKGLASLAEKRFIDEFFWRKGTSVMALNPGFEPIGQRIGHQDTRMDRRGFRFGESDPEPEAGRTSSIPHGLTHIDEIHPIDRILLSEKPVENASSSRMLLAIRGDDQGHPAVPPGQSHELRVEKIAFGRILQRQLLFLDAQRDELLAPMRGKFGAKLGQQDV